VVYRLSRFLVWLVLRTLCGFRVEGGHHEPASGPLVIVSNHVSDLDPLVLGAALRRRVNFMAKIELFRPPLLRWWVSACGAFPVRRGEADRGALETALRVLAVGEPLGFFPEGTRSRTGALRRAKPGIGFLARRSGAPIVPVAISGTPQAGFPVIPRARILVTVGRPFQVGDLGATADDQALADAIMRRVASLLPSHMRGVYAEDRPYT